MLFASKTFSSRLPDDAQYGLGLLTDTTGYKLGVWYFSTSPMQLVFVADNSPAYSLGLRSGDTIVSVDEKQYRSGYELKVYLKRKHGEMVRVTVIRGGKERKLKIHIPDDLGKQPEQAK
jgi:predicted metalloprotease with PDZ domain